MEIIIMKNQVEKKMENEMNTGMKQGLYNGYIGVMDNYGSTPTLSIIKHSCASCIEELSVARVSFPQHCIEVLTIMGRAAAVYMSQ